MIPRTRIPTRRTLYQRIASAHPAAHACLILVVVFGGIALAELALNLAGFGQP